MSYLWNEFNIKTFPAETIVYRDGVFCPDLSTLPDTTIDHHTVLPVHVIYVGEISGENKLNLDIKFPHERVFLTAKIKNKKPAFLNIFIKNAGENSQCRGGIIIQNNDQFHLNISAQHDAPDTEILVHTKLIAHAKTRSILSGVAQINENAPRSISDISFSAMADKTAHIEFRPTQRIGAAPISADHNASIYRATPPQIQFLRTAGLSTAEINDTLREAFENSNPLF